MNEEGVIKFTLIHHSRPSERHPFMHELGARRTILRIRQLIGSDANGQGYGNLSARISPKEFLITGTQTGHLETLAVEHYATVTSYDLARNTVHSYGATKPSSETLTHAALYDIDPSIGAVFHVHSTTIWHAANALALSTTPPDVPYGTPAMARAIASAHQRTRTGDPHAIIMAGHQDGIIAYGRDTRETSDTLLTLLSRATEWQQRNTPAAHTPA